MWSLPGNSPPNEHNRCLDRTRGGDDREECGWEPYYQLGIREDTVNEGHRSSSRKEIMLGALEGSLGVIPSAMGGY